MAIWGKKEKEAQEALASAKTLIIKVKKKGIETAEAEILYREAKKAIRGRKWVAARKGIEEAKISAKRAYARGILRILNERIADLEGKITEMESRNLSTKTVKKHLKEARESAKKDARVFKTGLKAAKLGLKHAESILQKYDRTSGLIAETGAMIRRIEDIRSDFGPIPDMRARLEKLRTLQGKGRIDSAFKGVKKLNDEVRNRKERFIGAHEAVQSLRKVVRDSEVLGANLDVQSKLERANTLFSEQKFDTVIKFARENEKGISEFLKDYRDARHHVDLARDKVKEVKNWGFSAYEAEITLKSAEEALKENGFEKAVELSKESFEKASTVRERHKSALEFLNQVREEVERVKESGSETDDFHDMLEKAEEEFNIGDYGKSKESIKRLLSALKGLNEP